MKQEELNNRVNAGPCYAPPRLEVVSLDVQGVLCESGNESQYEFDWGDGGFTFQFGDGEDSPFSNN